MEEEILNKLPLSAPPLRLPSFGQPAHWMCCNQVWLAGLSKSLCLGLIKIWQCSAYIRTVTCRICLCNLFVTCISSWIIAWLFCPEGEGGGLSLLEPKNPLSTPWLVIHFIVGFFADLDIRDEEKLKLRKLTTLATCDFFSSIVFLMAEFLCFFFGLEGIGMNRPGMEAWATKPCVDLFWLTTVRSSFWKLEEKNH